MPEDEAALILAQEALDSIHSHNRGMAARLISDLIELLGGTLEGVCTVCGRGAKPGTSRCGYHSGHFNQKRRLEMAQIATISKVDNGFIVDRAGCSHTQESLVIADTWKDVLFELTKHHFKLESDYDLSQLRLTLDGISAFGEE